MVTILRHQQRVGAEPGQGQRHHEAGDDKERPAAELIRENPREKGGEELDHGGDDSAEVWRHPGQHGGEDGHGVEVERNDPRESREEHDGAAK